MLTHREILRADREAGVLTTDRDIIRADREAVVLTTERLSWQTKKILC